LGYKSELAFDGDQQKVGMPSTGEGRQGPGKLVGEEEMVDEQGPAPFSKCQLEAREEKNEKKTQETRVSLGGEQRK